jgi:hypothetical protein
LNSYSVLHNTGTGILKYFNKMDLRFRGNKKLFKMIPILPRFVAESQQLSFIESNGKHKLKF